MLNNNAVTRINLVLVTVLSGSMYFSRHGLYRLPNIVGGVWYKQVQPTPTSTYCTRSFRAKNISVTEGFGWIFGAHYRRDRKEALLVRLTTATFRMNGLPDPYPSCIRSRE